MCCSRNTICVGEVFCSALPDRVSMVAVTVMEAASGSRFGCWQMAGYRWAVGWCWYRVTPCSRPSLVCVLVRGSLVRGSLGLIQACLAYMHTCMHAAQQQGRSTATWWVLLCSRDPTAPSLAFNHGVVLVFVFVCGMHDTWYGPEQRAPCVPF